MEFFEKDLEEIIYLSNKEDLCSRGLWLCGKLKRQLRIGNYGISDIIEYKRPYYNPICGYVCKGEINIIELKNKKIGVSTFFQALSYLKGIRTYLAKKGIDEHYNYRITLIGRYLDLESSFCYLSDLFDMDITEKDISGESKTTISLYTYSYELNGIDFNVVSGYNLIDRGF